MGIEICDSLARDAMRRDKSQEVERDYRKTLAIAQSQKEIFRCAVEWYDFIDSKRGTIDAEGYAIKVVALSDAVKRWKAAQA